MGAKLKGRTPKPFDLPPSREFYEKVRCGGSTGQAVDLVVYHGTQGPTARGGAITLATRTDGSAHECHDSKESFLLAPDSWTLCGVLGANSNVRHIEDATFAPWSRAVWLLHKRTLMWSAHDVAHSLLEHDLPCHFVGLHEADAAGGLGRLRGWTYHVILSETRWCDSVHTDPAPGAGYASSSFPHVRFASWVDFYFHNPHIHRPATRRELRPKRATGKSRH
jgi:hypothetical protein